MTKRPGPSSGRRRLAPPPRLRIGISACLLGRLVRYDGTHRHQPWTDDLGRLVEWVPVCPEVELGLGTPREPIQLVTPAKPRPGTGPSPRRMVVAPAPDQARGRLAGAQILDSGVRRNDGSSTRLRLVGVETGLDHTGRMTAYARAKLRELARLDLCGFVLKARSPSCGPEGVPVLGARGVAAAGTGLFARAVRAGLPDLPVTSEERLREPAARAAFLRRARAYANRRVGRRGRTR